MKTTTTGLLTTTTMLIVKSVNSRRVGDAVFDVSIAAQKTYGLEIKKVELSDYTQAVRVPAFVREQPAVSNLQASCQMHGVIRRIFVQVGQSVREGDPLVELQLTGDDLATAQSVLLDSVQQLAIIESEIQRLEPATREGGIAKKNLIEKQYEKQRTESVIESKRQELLVRGLSEDEVDGIISQRQLVRSVVVRVPTGIRPMSKPRQANAENPSDDWVYSVEELHTGPGAVLTAGATICDLAYHEILQVEGQAYERDLPLLTELIGEQKPVSVMFGESANGQIIEGQKILFMDNHLDEETQTHRFYLRLLNSVTSENVSDGHRFRTWKYNPGQRGHVRLPERVWSDRLVLPADAVAEDGIDHVIFQRVAEHDHFHGDEPPHSEFKRLVVKVDFRDSDTVVVDHLDQLKSRHYIAVNNAGMLLRAMNDSTGGGHGHDHHGHEH